MVFRITSKRYFDDGWWDFFRAKESVFRTFYDDLICSFFFSFFKKSDDDRRVEVSRLTRFNFNIEYWVATKYGELKIV